MFFLLYTHPDHGVIGDFPKISDHFPNIFRKFPKISEALTFPKIAEDFRGRLEDVSITHQRIKEQ